MKFDLVNGAGGRNPEVELDVIDGPNFNCDVFDESLWFFDHD